LHFCEIDFLSCCHFDSLPQAIALLESVDGEKSRGSKGLGADSAAVGSRAAITLCALFSSPSRLTPKVQVLLDFLDEYLGTDRDPRLNNMKWVWFLVPVPMGRSANRKFSHKGPTPSPGRAWRRSTDYLLYADFWPELTSG
jgi:hypothetical protein